MNIDEKRDYFVPCVWTGGIYVTLEFIRYKGSPGFSSDRRKLSALRIIFAQYRFYTGTVEIIFEAYL